MNRFLRDLKRTKNELSAVARYTNTAAAETCRDTGVGDVDTIQRLASVSTPVTCPVTDSVADNLKNDWRHATSRRWFLKFLCSWFSVSVQRINFLRGVHETEKQRGDR